MLNEHYNNSHEDSKCSSALAVPVTEKVNVMSLVKAHSAETNSSSNQSAANQECTFKTGDILVSSWGYEQTNVTFYQVVGFTEKSIKLRCLAKDVDFNSDVDGYAKPIANQFNGESFTRRLKAGRDVIRISSYSCAQLWNGKPQQFTSYA